MSFWALGGEDQDSVRAQKKPSLGEKGSEAIVYVLKRIPELPHPLIQQQGIQQRQQQEVLCEEGIRLICGTLCVIGVSELKLGSTRIVFGHEF